MYKHSTYQRVRYADTDKMGYLYYGHYAKFYEIGRTEILREMGQSYRDMEEDSGIMLPVVHLESRYLSPAYYDDNIEIISVVKELPTKMITFHHELRNEQKKLINSAIIKLFFVEMKTGQRISIPERLKSAMLPYFQ